MVLQMRVFDPPLECPGFFIINGHTPGGSNINPAVPVLCNGFLVGGGNISFFTDKPVFVTIQILIGSTDPQTLPGIFKHTAHPDYRLVVFIHHLLERRAVISHQARITADPQIPVMTLGNNICLVG